MGFLQRQARWNNVAFPIFGAEERGSFSFTSCQIRENSKVTSGMLHLSLLEDEVVYGYLIHAYKNIKVSGCQGGGRRAQLWEQNQSTIPGMASPSRACQCKGTFSPWTWCGLHRRVPGLGLKETPAKSHGDRSPLRVRWFTWKLCEVNYCKKGLRKDTESLPRIHRAPGLGYTYTSQVRPVYFFASPLSPLSNLMNQEAALWMGEKPRRVKWGLKKLALAPAHMGVLSPGFSW